MPEVVHFIQSGCSKKSTISTLLTVALMATTSCIDGYTRDEGITMIANIAVLSIQKDSNWFIIKRH